MTSTRRRLKDFCHHPHSKLCQSHGSGTQPGRREAGMHLRGSAENRVLRQPSPTEASILWGLSCQQPDPQPCWQEGSLHAAARCPACCSRSGAGGGAAREQAPRCKRRCCHPVTGGAGFPLTGRQWPGTDSGPVFCASGRVLAK